jgi:hypothetical protein
LTFVLYLFMINLKMKKVKAFFYIFLKSLIPNYSYYTKILKIHFLFSFKYFVSLIVFLNFLLGVSLLSRYSPQKINFWLKSVDSALANFPSDLNIFIDKGYLISSYNRPYFFWLRDEKERLKLIFVIDESASEEKINQYQTKVLLTKTDLFIKEAGKVKKIPLSSFNQIIFNKETLKIIRQRLFFIEKFFYIFYFFILLFIFVFTFLFSFLVNLFYLFIASLLVFVLLKLKPEKKYHFKKVFQISFHAATLPLFLDYLSFSFPYFLPVRVRLPIKQLPFSLLFLFLLIIFVIVGVYEAYYNNHSRAYRFKKLKIN